MALLRMALHSLKFSRGGAREHSGDAAGGAVPIARICLLWRGMVQSSMQCHVKNGLSACLIIIYYEPLRLSAKKIIQHF